MSDDNAFKTIYADDINEDNVVCVKVFDRALTEEEIRKEMNKSPEQ